MQIRQLCTLSYNARQNGQLRKNSRPTVLFAEKSFSDDTSRGSSPLSEQVLGRRRQARINVLAISRKRPHNCSVNINPSFLIAIGVAASALVATPARTQVIVETGILSSPKVRDLGAIFDKASKEPKPAKPKTKRASAATTPPKPRVLPDSFSGETEDPMSVLDINADVLTRFTAALAAETARRGQVPQLTRLKYDEVGAAAGGFTPRQYFVLKARVGPFCEAVAAGQPPSNTLTLSYMPTEAVVIQPRCSELLPALKLNR